MRVTSDRQTLILAGETPPRPSGTAVAASGQSSQRVTIISARVDAVVTQDIYAADSYGSLPAIPPEVHQAYVVSNRGSSSSAVSAYARSSDLSERTPLIDTYA